MLRLPLTTNRLLPALSADDAVLKLAFSPDGKTLTVGGARGGVRRGIFALPAPAPMGAPSNVSGQTADIRVSPDSCHVVVTGADGRSGLYDLANGKAVAVLGDAAQTEGGVQARPPAPGVSCLQGHSLFRGD